MRDMKKTVIIPVLLVIVVALLCAACEITFSSATEEIFITPSAVTILKNNSMAFKAIGGYSYRWSIKEPTWGSLSSARGPKTVYTSRYDPRDGTKTDSTQQDTQILYLESYIAEAGPDGGDGSTTNGSITVLATAEAQITHVSRCDDEECADDVN